ncbi:carboxypeptidase S1 [Cercophora scortea]|uniref:Carboxypeptidase S1 n=1 Tax=Cercophora scortea TaxID=314031 RepID=A0AAE0IM92_9PEZI|nr:carboxypeptidase S1 [Cercophora scortea]
MAGLLLLLAGSTLAAPSVIRSRQDPGVSVTYQQTRLCETNPNIKSYSGYITLPASAQRPYPSNLFFWFFEARDISPSLAPLTLWLQGGPGEASANQAVSGHNGPCIVQDDSNSTVINPWSWSKVSNMLYLDQPVQTGYSFDGQTGVEGVMDMVTGNISPGSVSGGGDLTSRVGTFASQAPARTVNTTAFAMDAVGCFLELWFQRFSQYKRPGINIWSQSYGGHYAPDLAARLLARYRQYNRSSSFSINVDSVGIINGVIDLLTQVPYYPQFAVNNTYGIKAISDAAAASAVQAYAAPGGCRDQAAACQQLQLQYDPQNTGSNASINAVCGYAFLVCWGGVYLPYEQLSGRNPFDIAHSMLDSFPPPYSRGFLNNDWVQRALGAKVNFTETSNVVANSFVQSGDFVRGYTGQLGALLDAVVKVALLYGDRDYRANWFGGEAISLAIPYGRKQAFAAAGYTDIKTNGMYVGGKVRQYDRFSFSRVFEAGHEVPYYQPETAFRIFARTILGLDVATGRVIVARAFGPRYSTTGPSSVLNVTNAVPPAPQPECYVDAAPLFMRCTQGQIAALLDGTAVVNAKRVVVSPSS